jgi:hypothetical protein
MERNIIDVEKERLKSYDSFTVKVMTRADMDNTINWAAREGWNPYFIWI